ncbi:hypothetical protein KQI52_04505 [bacterium]|nr:hypothetical protein [bacterium]
MTDAQGHPQPLSDDLAFFGRISAGVTHELNNVVSIIEQVTGLLEDQLYSANAGGTLDVDKLQSVHDRIMTQIDRGVELIHNLNRFSHTVDEAERDTDLNELMAILSVLGRRFAALKNVSFDVSLSTASIIVRCSPYRLLEAMFAVELTALTTMNPDDQLTLAMIHESGRAGIRVTGGTFDNLSDSMELSRAQAILAEMNGELQLLDDDTFGQKIEIWLPATVITDVF